MDLPAEPRAGGSLLRTVVDSLDGRMCVISAQGAILDTNRLWDEACHRLGWNDAQQGGNLFDVLYRLPLGIADQLRHTMQQVVREAGASREVRGVWPFPTGDEHVVVRVHPVHGHSEARAAVIAVDITDYMRTREELRRTAEQARLMSLVARHTDSGVVISDATGQVEWANDAYYLMTGYSPAEFIGINAAALYREALKDTPELEKVEAALSSGVGAEAECRLRTKDGDQFWVHLEVQPVRQLDGPDRVVSVMRNITTRRLAEDRLRDANREATSLTEALQAEKALLSGVIETLPHLVYLKDNDLRYRGVNPAFRRTRGLQAESELIGRTEAELGLGDPLTEVLLSIETEILATGQPVTDLALTLPTVGGSRRLLLSVLPHRVRPAGGGPEEIHGLIGVGADVSHVTELERQLAESSRLESIGQLAAGIAHEINTPIQFILDNTRFVHESFADLIPALRTVSSLALATDLTADQLRAELTRTIEQLDIDFLTDEVPSALTQSLEGLERVTQIVRATKDFSHPGQERTDADLNRAVENTVQVSRSEWKYVARLELLLDPAVGLVPCYEGELKQVLLNIIVNAAQALAEHNPEQGPDVLGHIRVSTRRTGDVVRIEISDNGPGMAPEVRQRVFDPFFTTKEVGKGTGQGLSIAYNVVVGKHQGTLEVESAPGQGTTFVITLPVSVDTRAGDPSPDGWRPA